MPMLTVRARLLEVDSAPVRVRIVDHEEPSGIYLDCSAAAGSSGHEHLLERLCESTGLTVVSVERRPGDPPGATAAVDLCERAARWVAASARHEQGTERLLIGGRAGPAARVAAATLVRLARHPAALPFAPAFAPSR